MTTSELIGKVKKNPTVTICAVLAVALAVGIYLRLDAIPTANQKLDEASSQARRYALNISNASQLKEQLEALKEANKVIESRLLHPSDIGINQQYFYKLESDSGIKLTDLRQGGTGAAKGAYVPITFNISLQGDFASDLKFLRALEDGTHYVRVLAASASGPRSGPVSVNLTLEILGRK